MRPLDYITDMDDAELLGQARKGDAVAFSQLFGRHQRAVYRYAAYMCGRDAADDVVQETFLAVLRQAQAGRDDQPQGEVRAYLIGIARHLALKRLASRQETAFAAHLISASFQQPSSETDDNATSATGNLAAAAAAAAAAAGNAAAAAAAVTATAAAAASNQATVLDELTRAETIDAIRAAVQSLPAAYREVVVLCELEEMDYAAAAIVLQCPIGTIRSRLHRARALLLTKLTAAQAATSASR
jgi:RNA polymerase sigma-70 factor (ECF subfamily)